MTKCTKCGYRTRPRQENNIVEKVRNDAGDVIEERVTHWWCDRPTRAMVYYEMEKRRNT